MKSTSENKPNHHTQKIKAQMCQLIDHLRLDIGKITEAKAQALFETSAEVLTGLVKAFDDYEKKSEVAWRTKTVTSRPKNGPPVPQGVKARYADKQKRQAEHIEAGYAKKGVNTKTAKARAWATVQTHSSDKKSGSSRKKN